MTVTIKDVAALAGVSPSTVSRPAKIIPLSVKRQKNVSENAMIELGYEPNFRQAISLHRIHVRSASFSCFCQRSLRELLLSGGSPGNQPLL